MFRSSRPVAPSFFYLNRGGGGGESRGRKESFSLSKRALIIEAFFDNIFVST